MMAYEGVHNPSRTASIKNPQRFAAFGRARQPFSCIRTTGIVCRVLPDDYPTIRQTGRQATIQ